MIGAIDPGRLCAEDLSALVRELNKATQEVIMMGVESHDEHTRLLAYKRALELIAGVTFTLENAQPDAKGRAT